GANGLFRALYLKTGQTVFPFLQRPLDLAQQRFASHVQGKEREVTQGPLHVAQVVAAVREVDDVLLTGQIVPVKVQRIDGPKGIVRAVEQHLRHAEAFHVGVRIDMEVQLDHPSRIGHVRKVQDRKSTRLNSSHVKISYAVFCLK